MVDFNDWTTRLQVYVEYVKALGVHKLNLAEAELKIAEAAEKWADISLKRTVIQQLKKDLTLLNKNRSKLMREIGTIKDKLDLTLLLLQGIKISPQSFLRGWTGYIFLQKMVVSAVGSSIYDLKMSSDARPSSNYINLLNGSSQSCPDGVTNVVGMVYWLRSVYHIPVGGSSAHERLASHLAECNKIPRQAIGQLNDRLEQLKSGSVAASYPVLDLLQNDNMRRIEEA